MKYLIQKYLNKLESQGLAGKDNAAFLALDAELVSNKPINGDALELSKLFDLMNINSILFSAPAEPYKSIIREIIRYDSLCAGQNKIIPMDCETRTFFHDIPVVNDFSAEAIAEALSHRKSAILKDMGIVTYGVVTPEQAFVSFSSTCFSTFVKYFYDSLIYLEKCNANKIKADPEFIQNFNRIAKYVKEEMSGNPPIPPLAKGGEGGFNEDDVIKMLSEAGRAVVGYRLVDSYFGNISYVYDNKIYISETGSSMDELERCIDAVPLDGSSSVGITASSELSAHKNIYMETGHNAILHGHPKFSVIMSMHCLKEGCDRSTCHIRCKEKRYVSGTPIVSGEIGTGPTGLMHTVPAAMAEGKGVIVYGHGVFTSGQDDFQKPFSMLLDIETGCRQEYFSRVDKYLE
ncbi:MAG: class II aldolase/adducin family protein [Nitrospirae bacterium]|nr:class II aldolase/adducin family protein [Nitrospirota bacterium]